MQTIPDDLITVAVYQSAVEANLIKNQLAAAGIKAYLSGEEAAAMAWHMAGAFGGVKVQVASRDSEDALLCLERKPWLDEYCDKTAFASTDASAEINDDEDQEEILSEREKNANRLGQAAIFGLLFWPLEAYAFWLLLKVYYSSEKLEGRALTNARVGGAIALAGFIIVFMVMMGILRVLL